MCNADSEKAKEICFHEAGHCPAGRLIERDKNTEQPVEPKFDPSIGFIEDPQIKVSGPIWVKGGIRIEIGDGKTYEIRNRVTFCRCCLSSNTPFFDGTLSSLHLSILFQFLHFLYVLFHVSYKKMILQDYSSFCNL